MGYGPDAPVDFGDAKRVVMATVLNWASGMRDAPTGEDLRHLIQMLSENVESDRAWFRRTTTPKAGE